MSRSGDITAISCPSCGAGLDVLGGGRVTTHVCGYCGAELDAVENYRVLRKFTDLKRPGTPFRIGMTGTIRGVEHRLIGIMASHEASGGRSWDWTDHLLFSPTHGYCWLTLEDGHLILTRRFRGAVQPGWMGVDWVESAESPPKVVSGGAWFKYYETSDSKVVFVEGEFTWRPGVGDSAVTVSAMSSDAMLSFSQTDREREVERSTYLPQAETWASFGIDDPPRPVSVHPLQPFVPGPNARFQFVTAGLAAAACVVIALFLSTQAGKPVLSPLTLAQADLPAEVKIPIDRPERLAVITIEAAVSNAWTYVDFDLTDPADQPVFIGGREISYYHGYDDGYWSEGSTRTTLRFRPQEAGTYTLALDRTESGHGEAPDPGFAPALIVTARDGVSSPFWITALLVIFAGLAIWPKAAEFIHNRRRWRGTDWTDDD